jgi:putative endonuclease
MTNHTHAVLYTGVTNNLIRRIYEHKEEHSPSFTQRYHVTKLVYYEACHDMNAAIAREKQIKGGSRQNKQNLIQKFNPSWSDLYQDITL